MSSFHCCFLTCIQIAQEADKVVWYSHIFHNFPQFIVIHTVRGLGVVNKAEADVFLELSWFFDDPAYVGSLISGSSAFSKPNLNIWKYTVHVLLKPVLENYEHFFASMWDKCNYEQSLSKVWTFFGIVFLWDWNENWPFPVLWPLLSPIVCSNSCPLSQWCHPSHLLLALFPFAFSLSQHHGLFQWVRSSHQVFKVLELQLQHQSFQWIFRVDFF